MDWKAKHRAAIFCSTYMSLALSLSCLQLPYQMIPLIPNPLPRKEDLCFQYRHSISPMQQLMLHGSSAAKLQYPNQSNISPTAKKKTKKLMPIILHGPIICHFDKQNINWTRNYHLRVIHISSPSFFSCFSCFLACSPVSLPLLCYKMVVFII